MTNLTPLAVVQPCRLASRCPYLTEYGPQEVPVPGGTRAREADSEVRMATQQLVRRAARQVQLPARPAGYDVHGAER